MNVFIDTNILLNFYHYTNDELDALESVFVSQRRGNLNLCVTEQIVDEFYRNRESKLKDAMKRFNSIKVAPQLPSFMQEFGEYTEVLEIAKELQDKLNVLSQSSDQYIQESNLDADILIDKIFKRTDIWAVDKDCMRAARTRVERGNPPGKNGSLGDAINWELLLINVNDCEELCIISEDGDYYSTLNENEFSTFLKREWSNKKGSTVFSYKNLRPFMKEHHDGKYLSFDKEKRTLLLELAESRSFSQTHETVSKLSEYEKFSLSEVKSLFSTADTNSQVGGIATDYDVCDLLLHAADGFTNELDKNSKTLIEKLRESVKSRD